MEVKISISLENIDISADCEDLEKVKNIVERYISTIKSIQADIKCLEKK
ncbi:MAG: hypothetical protein ACTSUC_12095 [Promethearchaeota archaeon]